MSRPLFCFTTLQDTLYKFSLNLHALWLICRQGLNIHLTHRWFKPERSQSSVFLRVNQPHSTWMDLVKDISCTKIHWLFSTLPLRITAVFVIMIKGLRQKNIVTWYLGFPEDLCMLMCTQCTFCKPKLCFKTSAHCLQPTNEASEQTWNLISDLIGICSSSSAIDVVFFIYSYFMPRQDQRLSSLNKH